MSAIGMPGHLLALFTARPPLERLPTRGRKQYKPYTGLAEFVNLFEKVKPEPLPPFISPAERRKAAKAAKEKEHAEMQARRRALYDPHLDPDKQKTADPRRTLFVGRLSYDTTEKKLLKTFEQYGPVRDIRVVADLDSKPRGYAFIEFKTEEGMWNAYKNANQKVIDGRPILVDTEKARTVPGWLPRRLGGGEGPPRRGGKPARPESLDRSGRPLGSRGGRGGRGYRGTSERPRRGGGSRLDDRGGRPRGAIGRPRGGPYDRHNGYNNDRYHESRYGSHRQSSSRTYSHHDSRGH